MADAEHVDAVEQGVLGVLEWRGKNPGVVLDLSDADLNGVNLSLADLSGADLSGADLTEAELVKANLGSADLSGANLRPRPTSSKRP